MTIRISLLVGLTLISATLQGQSYALGESSRCQASASRVWAVSANKNFTVEAFADGPDCAKAALLLVIRNAEGEAILTEASKASDLLTFAGTDPTNDELMETALKDWIVASGRMTEAGDLPAWREGAEAPGDVGSEFPFYTDQGMTREDYETMRAAKLPLFCYVQGMESQACLVLTPDAVIAKVGVQTFPG